jgi:tetratricopeptide (TPR) repeat protein
MSINKLVKCFVWVILGMTILAGESCVTKKRKKETSKLSKFYHNVTSEYNGYFNANELMEFAIIDLQAAHVDNYSEIIELQDFVSVPDPKIVNEDMDKAIEKVTRVAALHEKGDWVDDCYVLMGKAQYLKQDYESAVETFEYFQEDFNPANPYGRNFQKKKLTSKEKNKQRKKERKAEQKAKEKERERIKKQREEEKKAREKERKRRKKGKKTRTPKRTTEASKTTSNQDSITQNLNTTPKENSQKKTKKEEPNKTEDKTAYNKGLVWLAKSYIAAGKYTSAEFLLNRLEKIGGLPKIIVLSKDVAFADLLIKTGKEYKALDYIDKALTNKKAKRSEKGRYAFVAGQILMEAGQYRDANQYFKIAKKKSSDYKMKFMSELNMIKGSQMAGGRSRSEVAGSLEKMLKETKYAEFKDQIYFTLGEISVNDNDLVKAKEYFSLSLANSSGDKALMTEAYYKMATMSYNEELYADAKYYYDSTLMQMTKFNPKRKEVKKFADNLTDIAKKIELVDKLTSTIAMGDMSDQELMKIAKKRLEEEEKTGKKTDTKVGKKNLFVKENRKAVLSDFWAYNIVSKENGKRTFMREWGQRPLVDNWRLKSKINEMAYEQANEEFVTEEAIDSSISREEYERVMADVPKNALAVGKLKEQLREAKFSLGKLFRDKIQNYARSASTLEEVNEAFKRHKDLLDSYYYLYLDFQDLNDLAKVKVYREKILGDFPESHYAKLIQDPSYAQSLENERNKLDRYYDKTFELFQQGEYKKVNQRFEEANKNFGEDNKLIAKFTLLNAMALGYTMGQEEYIKALNTVVVRFPNTPEETKAKEIMRFLKGDKSALGGINVKEVDDMFTMDEESRHYIAVVLFDYADAVLQDAKIAVSDYNKRLHSKDRLQLGEMLLNKTENTQIILVRSFPNKKNAMSYYEGVMNNKAAYIPEDLVTYELLPVSQQNFRKMLQQRTHSNYRVYFNKNYLEQE